MSASRHHGASSAQAPSRTPTLTSIDWQVGIRVVPATKFKVQPCQKVDDNYQPLAAGATGGKCVPRGQWEDTEESLCPKKDDCTVTAPRPPDEVHAYIGQVIVS